jgi:hypothetical protein
MKEEIVETFSLLHDGFIEFIEGNESELRINISIGFLLIYINQDYTSLNVVLNDISEIEYIDWSDNKTIYSDLETIISIAKGIWLTKSDFNIDGRIAIHGHGGNSNDETSCGGSILFNSGKYRIFDDGGNELSLSKLKYLNELYWNNFGKKT